MGAALASPTRPVDAGERRLGGTAKDHLLSPRKLGSPEPGLNPTTHFSQCLYWKKICSYAHSQARQRRDRQVQPAARPAGPRSPPFSALPAPCPPCAALGPASGESGRCPTRTAMPCPGLQICPLRRLPPSSARALRKARSLSGGTPPSRGDPAVSRGTPLTCVSLSRLLTGRILSVLSGLGPRPPLKKLPPLAASVQPLPSLSSSS